MKKFLIALLALVMVFALAVPVLADTVEGDATQNVTAGYEAGAEKDGGKVYRVTIEWTLNSDASLKYVGEETTYEWNTETLKYESKSGAEGGWEGTTGYTVKVTNFSNAQVGATVSANANYGLTAKTEDETSLTLKSAALTSNGDEIKFNETEKQGVEQSETVTYTYSDEGSASAPTNVEGSNVTIGTITVTVNTGA